MTAIVAAGGSIWLPELVAIAATVLAAAAAALTLTFLLAELFPLNTRRHP